MAVQYYYVSKTVIHQSHEHRADVNPERILWNVQAAGIRREDVRNAIGNMRSDQPIDVASDGIGDRHGHGIVRAVVDETMCFQRPNSQDHGFDLRRDKLLKFLPVEIVHRA